MKDNRENIKQDIELRYLPDENQFNRTGYVIGNIPFGMICPPQ